MADIKGLVEAMVQSAGFDRIVNNPLAQFGTPARNYLGATLLPEREVPENAYTETAIKYRTVIANDGTRYSPVQKKGGVLTGTFNVVLGNSDIGSEFTGADYDALIRLIERTTGEMGMMGGGVDRPTMQAMASLTQWADMTLNRPLLEKNEKQRWEAIVSAQVVRTGDNGYTETVKYPNPTGHRVAAGGTWSSNSYDPYADIVAAAEFLAAKGYTVNRMITSTTVRSKLTLNAKMVGRVGRFNIAPGTTIGTAARASLNDLNELFSADGLPSVELYDLQYRTQTSSGFFLPRTVFVLVATTGRDESIDLGDLQPLLMQDTLGYVGVGRAAGQSEPGRKTLVTPFENKPPRIEGEAWQTSLPVVTEPEAIFVITGIS